jgi:hypothetical protein
MTDFTTVDFCSGCAGCLTITFLTTFIGNFYCLGVVFPPDWDSRVPSTGYGFESAGKGTDSSFPISFY